MESGKIKHRDVEPFTGTVILKDWTMALNGQSYLGFVGRCMVMQDCDVIGFKVNRGESNWMIHVDGDRQSFTFPGCQVRGFIRHSLDESVEKTFYRVP